MPNVKPLKKDYKSIRELYASFPTVYKNMVYHACDGSGIFVTELSKVNWDSLSDSEVKELIILMLSYGLETNEEIFKPYITAQYTKPFSIFNSLINHDIKHIKMNLNDRNFQDVFTSIFMGDTLSASRVLSKIKTRISKMVTDIQPESDDTRLLTPLISSLIQGRNIALDGSVIESEE